MLKHILIRLSSLLVLFALAACGGGGGSGSSAAALTNANGSYTNATLKIALVGTLPSGTSIAGVNFTLFFLPELKPAMTNGAVAAGVVTPSGTFATGIQLEPVYTAPATATSYGNLLITLADTSQAGVTQVGEIGEITLQLPSHAAPTSNSYMLSTNGVIDLAGNPITTLRAVVSEVTLQ